jgi:hypothetical protein
LVVFSLSNSFINSSRTSSSRNSSSESDILEREDLPAVVNWRNDRLFDPGLLDVCRLVEINSDYEHLKLPLVEVLGGKPESACIGPTITAN